MMPQDGMGPNNGQHMYQNGQMPPQGQSGQIGSTRSTWPNASRGHQW